MVGSGDPSNVCNGTCMCLVFHHSKQKGARGYQALKECDVARLLQLPSGWWADGGPVVILPQFCPTVPRA